MWRFNVYDDSRYTYSCHVRVFLRERNSLNINTAAVFSSDIILSAILLI